MSNEPPGSGQPASASITECIPGGHYSDTKQNLQKLRSGKFKSELGGNVAKVMIGKHRLTVEQMALDVPSVRDN